MTITAEEASAQFLTLLDRVVEGEPVTITRQGVPVASVMPVPKPPKVTPAEAIEQMKELRKGVRLNGLTIRELIDEGRSF